jgi:Fe-S cluster assembly iron-binding protein IscA
MLRVTENAKKELKRILAEKVDNPLAGIRLMRSGKPDNYDLAIDVAMPNDQVVEYHSSKVLLVEQELSEHLDGNVLDVEDTPQGKGFVVIAGK